uniref:Uncharacterized protein n=1 Tax=Anguilla anguilla TaxID=7936 RepID=A0A0E9TX36_ANGAN
MVESTVAEQGEGAPLSTHRTVTLSSSA